MVDTNRKEQNTDFTRFLGLEKSQYIDYDRPQEETQEDDGGTRCVLMPSTYHDDMDEIDDVVEDTSLILLAILLINTCRSGMVSASCCLICSIFLDSGCAFKQAIKMVL